ncbi:hypothetical protein C3L33_16855, partial [Rhododendron williamsianum]
MAAKKGVGQRKGKKKEPKTHRLRLHDVLLSPDCILKKVFRKDGPALGVEFDTLPSYAFQLCKKGRHGSKCSHRLCQDKQRALKVNKACRNSDHACDESLRAVKKRKVSKPTLLDYQVSSVKSAPVKKHGIGKGLMTVWRAINPDGGDIPTGVNFNERESTAVFRMTTSAPQKPLVQEKKSRKRQPVMIPDSELLVYMQRKIGKRIEVKDKRKPPISRRKLIDDEELELQELRAGPSPLTCSAHFATSGLHGCSLCKDLLAKFPPNSVVMKLPFYMQPWGSSPELVKKLFKSFKGSEWIYGHVNFLSVHAQHDIWSIGLPFHLFICSAVEHSLFTLEEFAQTFHDKESMLLGQIHLSLLKLLVSDVETELSRGVFPPVTIMEMPVDVEQRYIGRSICKSVSCALLAIIALQLPLITLSYFDPCNFSVENQHNVVEFWKKSLNPLTWTEILRQVFIAAGFGSKNVTARKESLSKEATIMVKYGLSPATLKGELFSILSEQGNKGIKVSDLANSPQEAETFDLDSEDFGSVDNDSKDNDIDSSDDDSECSSDRRILDQGSCHEKGNKTLTVYTEIDESHPGEVWLLGLVEGEYSDLSIDEKLNALVALVDLLSAGSSIRMEVIPLCRSNTTRVESVPSINNYGSGAKIKRSSGRQHSWPSSFGGYIGQMLTTKDTTSGLHPVDSSAFMLKFGGNAKSCSRRKYANERKLKMIYILCNLSFWVPIVGTIALDCRGAREAYLLASLKGCEAFMRQSIQSDQSDLNISRDDSSSAVSELDNNISLTEMNNDFSVSSGSILLKTETKNRECKNGAVSKLLMHGYGILFILILTLLNIAKGLILIHLLDVNVVMICTGEMRSTVRLAIPHLSLILTWRNDMQFTLPHSVMPEGALVGAWIKSAHKLWIKRLRRTSTLAEYMQVLADFVGAINEEWCQSEEDQGPILF